jgi:hypothetical protein
MRRKRRREGKRMNGSNADETVSILRRILRSRTREYNMKLANRINIAPKHAFVQK